MSFKFPLKQLVSLEVDFLKRYGFTIPREFNPESMQRLGDDEPELMRIYAKLRKLPKPATAYFCSSNYDTILGVYLGETNLPEKWISPLNDRLKTRLCGMSELKISELAERTFRLALQKNKRRT